MNNIQLLGLFELGIGIVCLGFVVTDFILAVNKSPYILIFNLFLIPYTFLCFFQGIKNLYGTITKEEISRRESEGKEKGK